MTNTLTVKLANRLKLVLSLGAVFLVGGLGSLVTGPAVVTWYPTLNKPWFSPPDWLFAPVWIGLYVLIGISGYLVWMEKKSAGAMRLFWIQVVLNGLWSVIFFGLRNPTLALAEIAILWLVIAAMTKLFWKISKPAAYLLVPYLLWVSFAAILNLAIVLLN